MRANIKLLSQKTGYSQATISNVLNGKTGVNTETANHILRVARDEGYFQSKKIKKTRLILYKKTGEILDDTPFFACLFRGIESGCKENGMKLEINTLDQRSPDFEIELQEILRDVSSGLLLLATEMTEEDVMKFKDFSSPIVILDNCFDGIQFPSVSTENIRASRQIVKYLYENNHRSIGFIRSKVSIHNFEEREFGYKQAMLEMNMPLEEEFIFEVSPTMEGAYEDMKQILAEQKKVADAYYAVNDMIAFGVMKALIEQGYRIPQDVSVVGFDDLPYSAVSSPALSTTRVYKEEMGKIGVSMLVDKMIASLPISLHSELGTEFIARESVQLK